MIDFGPDAYHHAITYGLEYSKLQTLLVPHSHEDHLLPDTIGYRAVPFAHLPENAPQLRICGNARVGEKVAPYLKGASCFTEIHPFETVAIGEYRITPLEAVHFVNCVNAAPGAPFPVQSRGTALGRSEQAMFYLIEREGKSLLYALDTDEFTPQDIAFLAARHIDLVVMDCTNGVGKFDYFGHMGAVNNLRMREALLQNGAADAHTVFVTTHFSHNGVAPMDVLQAALPGFLVAYDGMLYTL